MACPSSFTIDTEEWEKWKTQLLQAASQDAPHQSIPKLISEMEDRLRSKNAMSSDESGHAVAPSSTTNNLPTAVPLEAPKTTTDASTQVYTVSTRFTSSYVLRRHHAERTAKHLARHVGRLADQVHVLSNDMLRLLNFTVTQTGFCESFAQDDAASSAAGVPSRTSSPPPLVLEDQLSVVSSADRGAAFLTGILEPSSMQAVCAGLVAWRSHRRTGTADGSVQSQRGYLSRLLSGRAIRAFYAAPPKPLPTGSEGVFLCRRCRVDGRSQLRYDHDRRQLVSGNVSDKPAAGRSGSGTRCPPINHNSNNVPQQQSAANVPNGHQQRRHRGPYPYY